MEARRHPGRVLLATLPLQFAFGLVYCGGGLALAGSIAAARHAMPDRLGTASGLVTGAYAIAAPIQVPVISALAANLGWLAALRLMGGAMLGLAVVLLATMPPVPRPRHPAGAEHGHPSAFRLLSRPRLLTALLLEIAGTPLGAYAFVNAAAYAHDLRFAALLATAAITAVAVGNAAGRIAGGAASDRAGVDKVLLLTMLLNVLAAALLAAHPAAEGVVAGALLAGIGFGVPAGV